MAVDVTGVGAVAAGVAVGGTTAGALAAGVGALAAGVAKIPARVARVLKLGDAMADGKKVLSAGC